MCLGVAHAIAPAWRRELRDHAPLSEGQVTRWRAHAWALAVTPMLCLGHCTDLPAMGWSAARACRIPRQVG